MAETRKVNKNIVHDALSCRKLKNCVTMRLEKVLTNFRLAKCRLTVTFKVYFYVVCLKIENDFKAERVEDFQELPNNLWYHLVINFGIKEKLFRKYAYNINQLFSSEFCSNS